MQQQSFRDIDPSELPLAQRHQMLLAAVAPRPIAFASTVSPEGQVNLAPFSFFGTFGASPPYIAVSPANRGTNGQSKDTLRNALATGQLTISVVDWSMTIQMNIASGDYPYGTDEFIKSGLTKLPSLKVAPPGVAESPFILECELRQHIPLGEGNGAGHLLLAEVVMYRVRPEVMSEQGRIDPRKMDQISRLGGNWYSRTKEGLFELAKPQGKPMGFEALPAQLRNSPVLTGQDLGLLASLEQIPPLEKLSEDLLGTLKKESEEAVHLRIKTALGQGAYALAWTLVKWLEGSLPAVAGEEARPG